MDASLGALHALSHSEAATLAGTVYEPNLLAWYKLNEVPEFGYFSDSSGNNYGGGIYRPAGSTSVFTGKSFYFGGDATRMLTTTSIPVYTNKAFSWTLRVKTSEPNCTLIQRGRDPGYEWLDGYKRLVIAGSQVAFDAYGQTRVIATGTVADGQWHSLAAVYDGLMITTIYVDGKVAAEQNLCFNDVNDKSGFLHFFGSGSSGGRFKGELADIRFYSRALSETDVIELRKVGDINSDFKIDFSDLKIFSGEWLANYLRSPGELSEVENGDFELYDNTGEPALYNDQYESYYAPFFENSTAGSQISITSDAHEGSKALTWSYNTADTSGENCNWAEILYVFENPVDLSQYDQMKIWIKRHAGNSREDLFYIKLLNGGIDVCNIAAEEYIYEPYGSTYALPDQWYEWVIDLHSMSSYHTENGYSKSEDMSNISGIMFGCTNSTGGTGTIDIDDITISKQPECRADSRSDMNGDCVINLYDWAKLGQDWLKTIYSF